MDGKTDFFELPEEGATAIYGSSIQHTPEIQKRVDLLNERDRAKHTECIEIEHSDEYRRGVDAGIESFRPKFEEIKARFDQKIKELLRENEILKNPQCEQCNFFEFGMCQHFRSRDCYLYHRGGTVSLFELKES